MSGVEDLLDMRIYNVPEMDGIFLGVDPAAPGSTLGPAVMAVFVGSRPSLRFPLTEALAAEHDIPLWYFDPAKWPDRESLMGLFLRNMQDYV